MDLNAILSKITGMFPSLNLTQAVNKAQEVITGVPNTLEGAGME